MLVGDVRNTHVTTASATRNVDSVEVSRIGASISPSSRTWVAPTNLP